MQFLKTALKDFPNVASLFPSSSFAVRSILRRIPATTKAVVEYGPGNGVITKQLLEQLPFDARLLGVEINEAFATQLGKMGDHRLQVLQGDIVEESARLREWAPKGVDVVVSGIPCTFLTREKREQVVANTHAALREGGRFVVYQNSLRMEEPLKARFRDVRSSFEPRNILPYFIMVAHK